MCFRLLQMSATMLWCGLAMAAATEPVTIAGLEKTVVNLEIAANDPDVDADIKAALIASLKTNLASLQGMLEKAIQQPDAEKASGAAGANALSVYNTDLKLALAEQILSSADDKTKKLFLEWRSIPGNESAPAPGIAGARAALDRLRSVDDDTRVGKPYLDVKMSELKPAQENYYNLTCKEINGLTALKSDSSLASAVVTKLTTG